MDTRDPRTQNLLFLLSVAPMATGCIITTGDDVASSGTLTTPTTTTGSTPTSGTASTSSSTPMTAQSTSSGAADGSTSAADTTAGETDDEIPAACNDYLDKYVECFPGEAYDVAIMYCTEAYDDYANESDECYDAFVANLTCLSALPCEEFTDDVIDCEEEREAIGEACPPL